MPGGSPGKIDNKGKQGTFRESRVSTEYHEHNNGTKGYDVDLVDRDYKDGKIYRESNPVYREHTVGTDRPKDHDDSQAVKEYQEHESSGDGEGSGGSSK